MHVVSVHVPKTAGSTFGNYLTTIYGVDRVFKDYDDYPMNPLSRYNVDREGWRISAEAQVRALRPDFRAVHGHFVIDKYEKFFPEARRIAWVRHPVSWVISLYYFWKNGPRVHTSFTHPLIRRLHVENLSLIEFAEDPMVRDHISRVFLRGLRPEAFSFIGVQEHFNDDLKDLVEMMGWPEVEPGFENRSPEPGYGDHLRKIREDQSLIDRLTDLNEGDMALYEKALRLRARRLEEGRARAERHARRAELRARVDGDRGDRSSQVA